MDDLEQFPDTDTVRFIRIKARQLAGRYGYLRDEFEDIQQSLTLECIARFRHFDPRRGNRRGFIRAVVHHAIANMIESWSAPCRGYCIRHTPIIAASESDRGARSLADMISEDGDWDRVGLDPRRFDRTLHLKLDIERVIDALPADLGHICRLLMILDGIAQVAAAIGVSRATLHRRVRLIRAAFAPAGLHSQIHEQRSQSTPR